MHTKIIVTLLFAFSISTTSASTAPEKETAIKATFSSMPLSFTQNNGQWPDSILYRASAGGATMWFTTTGAYYQFTRRISRTGDSVGRPQLVSSSRLVGAVGSHHIMDRPGETPNSIEISMVKAEFVGSNLNASAMGLSLLEYKCNYFIGNEPDKWRTDVPNYESIQYQEVYPGIDLKYYGNGKQMEYDFIVSPGADFSKIQIRYDGAESLTIGENGELIIKIANGEIIEQPPIVHQIVDGRKVNLEGQYLVGANNSFSFAVDKRYNPAHELVIDPVLVYSTRLGGSDWDQGLGIAVDAAGAAYVTGVTTSSDFPTLNPYQGTFQGYRDVFVAKLSSSGNSLVYSTYLGGSEGIGLSAGNEFAYGIAVDAAGGAYVTGFTGSTNFPTLNPYQTYQGWTYDAFVTKLSSAGNSLVYSTYLGGIGDDYGHGIAVDAAGAAYVTGETTSSDFPTLNPYQETFQRYRDVFVTKLSSSGNSLVYSTYLGGSEGNGNEIGYGIAVDAAGAAYVTGETDTPNFPTLNPFQTNQGWPGNLNAFVTKFSNAGNSLVYSTYLGGGNHDEGLGIAVDAAGAAYVTGYTYSTDFPTFNPYQTYQGLTNHTDAFVTKLSSSGNSLVYSTYLGGSEGIGGGGGNEFGYGIAVDAAGAAYVTGFTGSTDFPTLNPYQIDQGVYDAFVTKFSSAGNSLIYSTYLGGNSQDFGYGIAVDVSGAAYVTGETYGSNFPILNPYQAQGAGAFVTKFTGDATPTYCISNTGVFCDDFDNGASSQWAQTEGTCVWDASGGTWRAALTGSQLSCVQSVGDNSWKNYRLEFQVKGIAGSDKIVRFRQNGNDRYFVNLRSDWNGQDELILGKFIGGVETILQSAVFPSQNGIWYPVRIDCVDEHIIVTVNGFTTITVDDITNPILSGGIALVCFTGGAGVCDLEFENVLVSDPFPHVDLSDNPSVFEIGDNISLTGSIRYFDGSPYPIQSGNFAVENPVKHISEIISVESNGSFQYSVTPLGGGDPGTYALTFGISTSGGIARNHFALAINDVVTSQYPNTPGMIGKIEIRTDVKIALGDHETIPPQPDWATFSKGPFGGYWTQAFAPATSKVWNATKDTYKQASSIVIGGVDRTTQSASGKLAVELMNSGADDCLFSGGLQNPKCGLAIVGAYIYGTSAFANIFVDAFHELVNIASNPADPILYPDEAALAHQAVDIGAVLVSVLALKPTKEGFTAASKFVVDAGVLSIDYIELIHKYLPAPELNKLNSSSSLIDLSFIAHDTSGLILAIGIEPRIENMCIVQSFSPVRLIVTDPRGRTVSWDTSEIPGSRYYRMDSNSDGDSSTLVLVPLDTVGNVLIDIVPDAGANPMDSFTVIMDNTFFQEPIVIADNLPISQVPVNPVPILTFENLGPTAPSLSVADSTMFSGYPAPLTWTAVSDPNPGHIISYDVIVATLPDFSDSVVLNAGTSTSFQYHSWMKNSADIYDTAQHFWKVRSHDDWGAGSYSATRSFSVSYCCKNLRGDVNGDSANVNILDLTFLVDRIFRGGPPAPCPEEGDVNSDGTTSNILDLTYLVDRIFRGGPPPGAC